MSVHILAIDPGETSGFIRASIGSKTEWSITHWGVWHGMDELYELVERHLFDELIHVVIEDYRIYPNRVFAHIGSQVYTAKEIGRVEWICFMKGVNMTYYAASKAKQAWPDSRIAKHVKMHNYANQFRHTKDALRHLLTYLEAQGVRL